MSDNICGKTKDWTLRIFNSFWVTVTGKSGFRTHAIQAKNKPTFLQSQFVGQDYVGCFKDME